jgi:hypothetical protein
MKMSPPYEGIDLDMNLIWNIDFHFGFAQFDIFLGFEEDFFELCAWETWKMLEKEEF